MAEPEPLPVIRVEQFDGSHEHPEVRRLRAENERLLALLASLPELPCCDRCRNAKAAIADEQSPLEAKP